MNKSDKSEGLIRNNVRTYLEGDNDAKEKESEINREELEQLYIVL